MESYFVICFRYFVCCSSYKKKLKNLGNICLSKTSVQQEINVSLVKMNRASRTTKFLQKKIRKSLCCQMVRENSIVKHFNQVTCSLTDITTRLFCQQSFRRLLDAVICEIVVLNEKFTYYVSDSNVIFIGIYVYVLFGQLRFER